MQSTHRRRNGSGNRRTGPDRRDGSDHRDGMDRRSGEDRRRRSQRENLDTTAAKRPFLLRKAIDSLWRRPSAGETSTQTSPADRSAPPTLTPRAHPRHECRTPVFLESGDSRKKSAATVFNYNSSGFYLETDALFHPTTGVILHMKNYQASAPSPENVPQYFCEVRWSRPLIRQDAEGRFAVGLKICSTLNEFTRLFSL